MNAELIKRKSLLIEKNKIKNLRKKYRNDLLLKYGVNVNEEEILDYHYTKQLYDDMALNIIKNRISYLKYEMDPNISASKKILDIMKLNHVNLNECAIAFLDYDGAFAFPDTSYKYMYYTFAIRKTVSEIIKIFLNSVEEIIEPRIIVFLDNKVISFLKINNENDIDKILIKIWNKL